MQPPAQGRPIDRDSFRPAGRSAWLNSILGTVALALAVGILIREGIESEAEKARMAESASLAKFQWTKSPVFTLAWSPDGRRLAASGFGPLVRVWELKSRDSKTLNHGTAQPRFVLGWSGDGGRLIVGGPDVPVESWGLDGDPEAGVEVQVPPGDRKGLAAALACSTQGRSIRLWGPSDGRLRLLPASCRSASTVAFSPDGRSIATGGADGSLHLWDLESGDLRWRLRSDGRRINSVAFSPDCSKAATGGDGPIRLWDVATGREIARLAKGSNGSATVAFSPDGRRIAGATWDGSIRVWDLATLKEQARFQGHLGQVLSLAWSPNGNTLASGGYDSMVRVWDVAESTDVARAD